MFRFPSPHLLWWEVGRSGKKKKNTWRDLGSFKKPGEAEPKDFISVDLDENIDTIIVNALASLTSESGFFLFLHFEKWVGRAMGIETFYLDGLYTNISLRDTANNRSASLQLRKKT